jgi:hypothetical protein
MHDFRADVYDLSLPQGVGGDRIYQAQVGLAFECRPSRANEASVMSVVFMASTISPLYLQERTDCDIAASRH